MRSARTWAPSAVLVAAVVVAVLVPREVASVVIFGLTLAAPLVIALTRLEGARPGSPAARILIAMSTLPVVLAISAVASANPYVGLVGRVQQHNGALLWSSWFLLAAILALRPQGGDVRRIAITVSVAAGVLAAGALADLAGADFGRQFSNESSGFLTSSQTLGQVLVLGIGAALAWALMPRGDRSDRTLAIAAAAVCAAGLAASGARAATIAAVGAAVAFALFGRYGRDRAGARDFALGTVGVVAGIAALASAAGAMSASAWWPDLNTMLSGRLTLWKAAAMSFARSPLLGRGPDQFQAVVSWTMPPGAPSPEVVVAADAHNMGLTMAATAGVTGVIALVIALAGAAYAVHAAILRSRFSPPVLALSAGLAAWLLAAQFSWVGEWGGLMAALLFGGLMGAGMKPEQEAPRSSAPALAVAAASVAALLGVLAFGGQGLATEARWFSPNSPQDLRSSALLSLQSPDPTLAEGVAQDILAAAIARRDGSTLGAIDSLLSHVGPNREWSVNAAHASVDREYLKALLGDTTGLEPAIQQAATADPSTGLWPFLGAVYWSGLDSAEDAGRNARAAMDHPLDSASRQWLNDNIEGP